ncbi:MAG: cofactor-independent phosphoglycerate mutase [Desulforhopalus sp.]|nr:cofactor-independent phosphoglycerate mutase [Desulforhopalus sp.]
MKYLLLVGDGMGDYPCKELNGGTPLSAAKTPCIDDLCRKGSLFFNHTVPEGFPPGSDVANMSLMGCSPAKYFTGRAPLEAAAMGISLQPNEYAFRCNTVTLDFNGEEVIMRDFTADHISSEEARELIAGLEENCSSEHFHFKPGVSYRNLVLFSGKHPGFATTPPHDHIGKDVAEYWNTYRKDDEWRELLDSVKAYLVDHPVNRKRIASGKNPANMIWLWGEGKKPGMPSLCKRFNITGTMVSAVDLLKGLGILGGLSTPEIKGATGYIDTNYAGKAAAAIEALKTQDFVFVHLEAPDEAGHEGSAKVKVQAIEDFDSKIVEPILADLRRRGEEFRVVVTMDHFTPISLRTHASDPVPTLLYDSREKNPGCGFTFSEAECTQAKETTGTTDLVSSDELVELLFERAPEA